MQAKIICILAALQLTIEKGSHRNVPIYMDSEAAVIATVEGKVEAHSGMS